MGAARRELQVSDREPGRLQMERSSEGCSAAADLGTGGEMEKHRRGTRAVVPLHARGLDRAAEAEAGREPRAREPERPPVVMRRVGVVRIRHRAQVRDRPRARPRVLHGLGAAAGARGVVRPRHVSAPGQDLAESGVYRVVGARRLCPDTAVDLIRRRGNEVVPRARPQLVDRVRARGHRLGLQRRDRPVRRRLRRDDAAQVRVERHAVDNGDSSAVRAQRERAVVLAPVELEGRAVALERCEMPEGETCLVASDREHKPRADAVRPGRKRPREATSVGHAHRRRAAHRDGARALREQDADA